MILNNVSPRKPNPERVVDGLFEETGLRASLVPSYTEALGALFDRRAAARLRAAGFTEAAAFLEPDQAVIDEAFGPEDEPSGGKAWWYHPDE